MPIIFNNTRGDLNRRRKLDSERVAVIKWRLANGDTPETIAADYGVTRQCISKIKCGRSWGDVKPRGADQ